MKELIGIGSRTNSADLGTGSAELTPFQARAAEAQIIMALGSRKCDHSKAVISELEGGGWLMDCADCDTRACADNATAWGLGWVKPA